MTSVRTVHLPPTRTDVSLPHYLCLSSPHKSFVPRRSFLPLVPGTSVKGCLAVLVVVNIYVVKSSSPDDAPSVSHVLEERFGFLQWKASCQRLETFIRYHNTFHCFACLFIYLFQFHIFPECKLLLSLLVLHIIIVFLASLCSLLCSRM